jgi:hypothetical protein
MALDETPTTGDAGHIADHAALKADYTARAVSPTIADYTMTSTPAEHLTIHNALHADHNALGNTPTLPQNPTSGHLSHHAALHTAYNARHQTITNLPPQPAAVAYGPANPALALLADYAHPGGMVISSRGNYGNQVYHDISAAGGHHLMYLDPIVYFTNGRYHDLMFNSSAYGGAVPKWPGNPPANSTGDLVDFRVGGVLQGKFEAILELMVSENPHMCGWFFDDIGSRSWFPLLNWGTFGAQNQADYRAGAIALCQTARTVADRHGLIFMVNGTWTAGTLASNGGGYPTLTTHGNALAEGGCIEHHDGEIAFWSDYMKASTSQWGEQSPITGGKPFCFAIMNTSNGVTEFRNDGNAAWVSLQTSNDYDGVHPWGTVSDFHPTGLPSHT